MLFVAAHVSCAGGEDEDLSLTPAIANATARQASSAAARDDSVT